MSKPLHVLFVADCQSDRSAVIRQLRRGGYEPLTTCVETAAAMRAALQRQQWDVVLADYTTSQFSALAALELLHQIDLDVPFIILSNSMNEQIAVTAMKAGAHDYVMKDNLARLVPAVMRELEDMQVRRERQQRQRHLRLLHQITYAAATILDEQAMLNALVASVRDLMEADGVTILLWSEHQGAAAVTATQLSRFPVQLELGAPWITEAVRQAGIPLAINDVLQTPFLSRQRAQQLPFRALLAAPLLVTGQKLGALVVVYEGARRFVTEEITRAEQAAQQIALAVAKSQLIVAERRQRALAETLREVAVALNSTLEREQVLKLILDQLLRVVAYDSASIMLLQDNALQSVAYRSTHELVQQATTLLVNELRHVQTILLQRRPLIIADTTVDARWILAPGTEFVRCWLGVPMLIQDRIIGLLNFNKITPNFYTEKDAQVAMIFAAQAAAAIENARLYAQQQQYAAQLEVRVAERTQALAAANVQLQELDRLKSKFVSDVTHELRTPLTNLQLYIDLLETDDAERQARYRKQLQEQAARLAQLITDILDLSRLEGPVGTASFTAVDLNKLIEEVIEAQQPRADQTSLSLTFVPDKTIPPVMGQRNQLVQVATNLIVNALNYTRVGGVMVYTTGDAAQQMVCLRVSDSGIGIDPQEKELIFQRFYRGEGTRHLSVPGTGLGLAIVQEIVALHGGRLEVDSQVNVGSTFRVWLPAAPQAST